MTILNDLHAEAVEATKPVESVRPLFSRPGVFGFMLDLVEAAWGGMFLVGLVFIAYMWFFGWNFHIAGTSCGTDWLFISADVLDWIADHLMRGKGCS